MTNYPIPYIDSCEQPHSQTPPPVPHSVPVGFSQYCRTCQPFFGHPHSGWCRYHEVFVSGLHNCPDYEMRCCEEENIEPIDQPNENKTDIATAEDNYEDAAPTLLTQLANMKRHMRSRRRRKRRIAMED
jgi:hypothetical protein